MIRSIIPLIALSLLIQFTVSAQDEHVCYHKDEKPGARPHNVDMQHLNLKLSFEPEKGLVKGYAELTFKTLQQVVDSVFLDAPGIQIGSVKVDGKNVEHTQTEDGLILYFEPAFTWDEDHTIGISYEASPRKGIYFIGWENPDGKGRKQIWTQGQGIDNRYWIPLFDDMSDKLTSEVVVEFDSQYKVLSNGMKLSEEKLSNGNTRWHYSLDKPHAPYLIMLAIGDYAIEERKSASGIPIDLWYYPEYPECVEPTYRYQVEMMDYMEAEFGVPYPWETYSQVPVQDFIYGAMENTTATIFGDFYFVDDRGFLDRYYIGTNAHELAHQWFGDYVTARSGHHMWLQESFATHYQKHFEKEVFGEDHFQWLRQLELFRVLAAEQNDRFPIVHSQAGGYRIYSKGSLVLDMLKYVVGEEAFNRALQHYLLSHPYGSVETNDFMLAFYEKLGTNLDWFFDEWLYRGGVPEFTVDYVIDEAASSLTLNVEQTHEMDELVGYFRMPLKVDVYYEDNSTSSYNFSIDSSIHHFEMSLEEGKELAFVIFDPGDQIIKTLVFERSADELILQFLQAENMIDRYDALVALRNVDIEIKRQALHSSFTANEFHAIRSEILRQLVKDPESKEILIQAMEDESHQVRETIASLLDKVDPEIIPHAKILLTDSSYNTIALALKHLCERLPDQKSEYLSLTEDEYGKSANIRIEWLKIASTDDEDYVDELIELISPVHEFLTRRNAADALAALEFLNEKAVEYMLEAIVSTNRRLSGPVTKSLKSFLEIKQCKKLIFKKIDQGTWTDEEYAILSKKFDLESADD